MIGERRSMHGLRRPIFYLFLTKIMVLVLVLGPLPSWGLWESFHWCTRDSRSFIPWYRPLPTITVPFPSLKISENQYAIILTTEVGSSQSSLATLTLPSPPCFNISARAKPGKVQLTWTDRMGTERYDIYRAIETDPSNFVKIGETTSTFSPYLDETALNETTFLYLVAAYAQGAWCYSDVVSSHPTFSRILANYAPVIY